MFAAEADSSPVAGLRRAGVEVSVIARDEPAVAAALVAASNATGTAVWLAGPDGDPLILEALQEKTGRDVVLVEMTGSWDLPGARLLDVVATMDRLRSPGGCPWDADQDHRSLAPYLIEEAYETLQTIEDGDLSGLCEELGDVLLQIAFHARLAEELPADQRWSIDDVATGLVAKLVRRHPHVFAGVEVAGAAEVNANWDAIKAAERGDRSPLANVAVGQPALSLAAAVQRKAAKAGLDIPAGLGDPVAVESAFNEFVLLPDETSAAGLLWSIVAMLRDHDIDAEAALRARARAIIEDATSSHR